MILIPNPYPWTFLDQLAQAQTRDPNSIVLDLGAGGRSLEGVLSLEYLEYPNNSLCGDCLALPLRDSCADLLLSQAVIEHVTSPEQAFKEMFRVLKPGGILYVEIAFMQPVHMNPHHFFNVTPNGLTWLLRDWEVLQQGTVGTARDVLNWIQKSYGLDKSKDLPETVPPDKYWWAASGVSALARRPV